VNADPARQEERLEAERGRVLLEESREMVVVLDEDGRVLAASRRARQAHEALREGDTLPPALLEDRESLVVPYELGGRRERLVYLRASDHSAYEELRAGFTASVSHELRTPLARMLVLIETAQLPGEDVATLLEQARGQVEQVKELIDDVLFLSELETGRAVVALAAIRVLPELERLAGELAESAARAGLRIRIAGDPSVELALRPRMLDVVVRNLTENAIRYAGPGSTLTLSVDRENGLIVLAAADDGIGVLERDLPRLFERFYRADRVRASRGTGLGLAIVKHIVASAGGTVDARSSRGHGLEIRCTFPTA
jgi:two-component system phosphate regulon sensor histidine kinase PhoR